jgi:diguanylate cyclase (GGDEF)-like protein/PAS domain S-box-containing protein
MDFFRRNAGVVVESEPVRADFFGIQRGPVHPNGGGRDVLLLRSLTKVAVNFVAASSPNEIFEILGSQLRQLGLNSAVMLFDPAGRFLELEYVSVGHGVLVQAEKLLGVSLSKFRFQRPDWLPGVEEVLVRKEPAFVHRFESDILPMFPKVPAEFFRPLLHLARIDARTSAYYLPLRHEDVVLGSLCVWGTDLPESDLPVYTAIASLLGNVFEKARLFQQARQELDRRKQAQVALERSREEYRRLFENAHDAIHIIDPDTGRILSANRNACAIYGYNLEELIGMNIRVIVSDLPEMYMGKFAGQLISNCTHDSIHYRKNGERMEMEVNCSAVEFEGRAAVMCISRDVTVRKRYERKLQHDALHDALTDLPNRELLRQRLELAIARMHHHNPGDFAILFLDLDQFKRINDSLGHQAGDQFLIDIAARLKGMVCETNLVSRLGGDEFVILLESLEAPQDAVRFCEKVLEEVTRPVLVLGHELVVTCSVGVVFADRKYNSPEEYLRDADIALYRAKGMGKCRYELFDATMHARALHILTMEADLRLALQNGELSLVYQPIVDLQTGIVAGHEALIRWFRPDGTQVPTIEFIQVAEESGLIHDLGSWVLETACKRFVARQEETGEFRGQTLSVNISGIQLTNQRFPESVETILAATGVNPGDLVFEITETSLITQTAQVEEVLNRLNDLGIRIHLDDFGTGYSSIAFLLRYPIHAIKIDRQYILGCDKPQNLGVIRSLVFLGQELGLKVIVEGIETVEQLELLLSIRCRFGQGYFLGRPAGQFRTTLDEADDEGFATGAERRGRSLREGVE